ncbi:type II toxin-antitoxin system RelB/DinJ family antitoxin [Bifidobacterium felsineum]|uniref:type II toxin-antitoxin system RelB/DinJ family antitoxin n=1 Tax=Bifidobacterium felsineum TaxID=2045440 RepID=UPI001BDBDE07|nr:type II toxin-antitoxin system RelB/DinJ family antitoxin [Bifidobacterium felsineum]MBT1164464.1 type II toxin-antitoxin system RelB/DinJ family antitoxin [Bifidobacterium felsineum]
MSTATASAEARISFRTDAETKKAATEVFNILGIDMSTALNMFLRQTVRDQALPFNPSVDSTVNVEARRQAAAREGRRFRTTDELRAAYGD